MNPCVARLVSPKVSFIGNTSLTVSMIQICDKNVVKRGDICELCSKIPINLPASQRIFHGKLTEPIPDDSRIYGSAWYWKAISIHGLPIDIKWMILAKKAEAEAESLVGDLAYKVKPPLHIHIQKEMPPKKKTIPATVSQAQAPPVVPTPIVEKPSIKIPKLRSKKIESKPENVIQALSPSAFRYVETIEPIEKVHIDSYTLHKETIHGTERLVCENKMVFSITSSGDIGTFIGRIDNGVYTPVS
jgi:hypothetical protein